MQTIYIEKSIKDHPRAQRIIERVGQQAHIIECEHYGEVFNPKSQNFRIQKQKPALILAKKTGRLVLPTPEGFGIGGQQNYYFSHMLNCLYDCRYCFLQGMYNSANYVLFINYEDFMQSIIDTVEQVDEPAYFFSGYDCDSLAFEPVTHFLDNFLPFFAKQSRAILECRTKSANIKAFAKHQPIDNCVIAFSFTPAAISETIEHKVPPVRKRIQAMQQLAEQGWQIGLRFDPLIYTEDFAILYRELIDQLFAVLKPAHIHSVSIGPLRFPAKMFQRLTKLYPKDKLLAGPLVKRDNHFSYTAAAEQAMKGFVSEYLKNYLSETLLFECSPL